MFVELKEDYVTDSRYDNAQPSHIQCMKKVNQSRPQESAFDSESSFRVERAADIILHNVHTSSLTQPALQEPSENGVVIHLAM